MKLSSREGTLAWLIRHSARRTSRWQLQCKSDPLGSGSWWQLLPHKCFQVHLIFSLPLEMCNWSTDLVPTHKSQRVQDISTFWTSNIALLSHEKIQHFWSFFPQNIIILNNFKYILGEEGWTFDILTVVWSQLLFSFFIQHLIFWTVTKILDTIQKHREVQTPRSSALFRYLQEMKLGIRKLFGRHICILQPCSQRISQ